MIERIGVIGAGPIGGILAGHLASSGTKVTLVDILEDHIRAIRDKGLRMSGMCDMTARIDSPCTSITELREDPPDVVFIGVKTSAMRFVLPELKEVAPPGTKVASLQNGLDTEVYIAETFGRENTLRVAVNYAGGFVEDGCVSMTFFNKPNYIGCLEDGNIGLAEELADLMTKAGLDTEYVPDIRKYVWEKTILNSALSPVCAITGLLMKEAMDFPHSRDIVKEVLKEGIGIAKADGYEYGDGFFEHCVKYLENAGMHKPSMHVDIEAGRATEIDFLNGKIVDIAKEHGMLAPYNRTITGFIRALEERNRVRGP